MDNSAVQRVKQRYGIVGNCEALNRAIEIALKIAPVDLSVLVVGENGVGKESFPRIIHDHSLRKNKKYFAVNCGAIPEGTIDSELFGHEKGAFTGAVDQREGYFAAANGGTLFLDEVGELPMQTQARLLRVLETGEYIRVGSSEVRKTDVRIVAATNVNMEKAIAEGKFREDLYYRLNAIQIKLPALRERKDDIYLLFRKFTSDFSQKSGLCKISLTHEGIAALQNYRWPGNIRQLKNFTEALTVMESEPISSRTDRVELSAGEIEAHLPQEFDSLLPSMPSANPAASGGLSGDEMRSIVKAIFDLKQEVDRLKRMVESRPEQIESAPSPHHQPSKMIDDADWQENTSVADVVSTPRSLKQNNDELYRQVLEKNDGKVKPAAAELGVSERTIYRWLDKQKKNA